MPALVISVPVGVTAVKALGVNFSRTSIGIVNNNPVAVIYWAVQDPSVSVDSGFPIFPRGSVTLVLKDGDETRQAIYVVSDLAAQNVRVYESSVR